MRSYAVFKQAKPHLRHILFNRSHLDIINVFVILRKLLKLLGKLALHYTLYMAQVVNPTCILSRSNPIIMSLICSLSHVLIRAKPWIFLSPKPYLHLLQKSMMVLLDLVVCCFCCQLVNTATMIRMFSICIQR
jgi:hypothetical protein